MPEVQVWTARQSYSTNLRTVAIHGCCYCCCSTKRLFFEAPSISDSYDSCSQMAFSCMQLPKHFTSHERKNHRFETNTWQQLLHRLTNLFVHTPDSPGPPREVLRIPHGIMSFRSGPIGPQPPFPKVSWSAGILRSNNSYISIAREHISKRLSAT